MMRRDSSISCQKAGDIRTFGLWSSRDDFQHAVGVDPVGTVEDQGRAWYTHYELHPCRLLGEDWSRTHLGE